jgi:hypothetical protein
MREVQKCCFIIPVHPPHFNWIEKMLKTMEEHQVNAKCIHLVFSNTHDYERFPLKDKVNHVIAGEYKGKRGIVTFKKFFALQQIYKSNPREYYIMCDAETTIIPANFTDENIIAKMDEWFAKKQLWGGTNQRLQNIIKTSTSLFNPQDQEVLRGKLGDWKKYTWWSDVPVYKHAHLDEFFEMLDPNYSARIEYSHFDHLVYQYFLMLRHDFTFIDTGYQWSLESHLYKLETLNSLKERGCLFTWVIPQTYDKNKEFYDCNGTFLLYHLDRKVTYSER